MAKNALADLCPQIPDLYIVLEHDSYLLEAPK